MRDARPTRSLGLVVGNLDAYSIFAAAVAVAAALCASASATMRANRSVGDAMRCDALSKLLLHCVCAVALRPARSCV